MFVLVLGTLGSPVPTSRPSRELQASADGVTSSGSGGTFTANYNAEGSWPMMYGKDPSGSGGAPVYVFANGGGMNEGPGTSAYNYVTAMAAKGFVAAQIDVDMSDPPFTCSSFEAVARQIFRYDGPSDTSNSAVSVLCRRPKADCSQGIAVHGFSLGGLYAYHAPKHRTTARTHA